MKLATSLLTCLVVASPAWAQSDKSANSETRNTRPEPPMMGKHLAKGLANPGGGAAQSPNLIYHNGGIMPQGAAVRAIFWGSSWASGNAKVGGIDSFYFGVGGTNYLGTNTEYTQTGGQHVGTTVSYNGHYIDTTAAPRRAPRTSAILDEVCKVLAQHGEAPVTNGYYPVYVDTKRGNTGYCAWHSWSSCGGVNIQFAFFFNLDGDPGCDPGDDGKVTKHVQGIAALGNVSGHELSEALTDPRGTGWYDSAGAENSDKCAWTFGHDYVSFNNGSFWKVQGNWSNAAYTAGHGYIDTDGGTFSRGCIDDPSQK
jgi:hypothetical protein